MAAAQILVSGIVQGVGYRWWAEKTAVGLGLAGWARNLDDGRVEIWVEGEAAQIDRLEEQCRRGPRSAEVEKVIRTDRTPAGASGFVIRRDGDRPED